MCVVAERKKGFQSAKWVKKWLGGKCWIVSEWKEKNERDMKDPFPSFVLAAHLRISCLARKNPLPLSLASICHVKSLFTHVASSWQNYYSKRNILHKEKAQIAPDWLGILQHGSASYIFGTPICRRDVMWQYLMYANVSYNVRQVIHLSQGILIS